MPASQVPTWLSLAFWGHPSVLPRRIWRNWQPPANQQHTLEQQAHTCRASTAVGASALRHTWHSRWRICHMVHTTTYLIMSGSGTQKRHPEVFVAHYRSAWRLMRRRGRGATARLTTRTRATPTAMRTRSAGQTVQAAGGFGGMVMSSVCPECLCPPLLACNLSVLSTACTAASVRWSCGQQRPGTWAATLA